MSQQNEELWKQQGKGFHPRRINFSAKEDSVDAPHRLFGFMLKINKDSKHRWLGAMQKHLKKYLECIPFYKIWHAYMIFDTDLFSNTTSSNYVFCLIGLKTHMFARYGDVKKVEEVLEQVNAETITS
jgi:hypothetical protein